MKRLTMVLCGGALGAAILLGTASSSPAFYWHGWPKGKNPPDGPPNPPPNPPPLVDPPPHGVPEPAAGIAALIGLTTLAGWRFCKNRTG